MINTTLPDLTSCVQVVLMMESVQRTNQSAELVDSRTGVDAMLTLTARLVTSVVITSASLRMSVLGMLTARMVSVMLTILLTILNVNFVKMENANLVRFSYPFFSSLFCMFRLC